MQQSRACRRRALLTLGVKESVLRVRRAPEDRQEYAQLKPKTVFSVKKLYGAVTNNGDFFALHHQMTRDIYRRST